MESRMVQKSTEGELGGPGHGVVGLQVRCAALLNIFFPAKMITIYESSCQRLEYLFYFV